MLPKVKINVTETFKDSTECKRNAISRDKDADVHMSLHLGKCIFIG